MTDIQTNYLLYDGYCPACSLYVEIAQLRQLYPNLLIANARSEPALVAELRRKGYEINEGMILCLESRIFFGADATHKIAAFGRSPPSRWRRAVLALTGTAPWSRSLYPWLNRGRQLLLRLLGRSPVA